MWYLIFRDGIFRPLCLLWFRARIEGEDNIPKSGKAIVAANHISAGDTIVLPSMIRRPVTFVAKAELFLGNRGLFSKLVAWFLKAVGQVPLDRAGGRASVAALKPVLDVLEAGGLVGIFPEGTRSPDGRLYKGKTGVGRLALVAQAPVIPVALIGTEMVKNRLGLPWMNHPRVIVGKPLDFSAYASQVDDMSVVRWVTDEVMNAIMELSGQTYVDAYGASAKHGQLSGEELNSRVKPRPGFGVEPPASDSPADK